MPAQTRFADGYPLLLIGQASLDDLNARLVAAGRHPLQMDRFRPNLVVDGLDACEEDFLATLTVGGVEIPEGAGPSVAPAQESRSACCCRADRRMVTTPAATPAASTSSLLTVHLSSVGGGGGPNRT